VTSTVFLFAIALPKLSTVEGRRRRGHRAESHHEHDDPNDVG
jgi:hypothetical protein